MSAAPSAPLPAADRPSAAWLVRAGAAVTVRPWLWATTVRQLRVLAPAGWWRRAPYLPLPDARYLRFRLVTAYGGGGADPDPHDVVTYLHWCRAWPRVTGDRTV